MSERIARLVDEARRALGVDRLALAIQDASFPGDPETDLGHGSPYGAPARALLSEVRRLGFDVLQLGPQGETSEDNPSPYDGAMFSRRTASIDAAALTSETWGRLLTEPSLAARVARRPPDAATRVPYSFARRATHELLSEARRALHREDAGDEGALAARVGLRDALARFRARHAAWLERDVLFECLSREHADTPWWAWDGPDDRLLQPGPAERDAFARRRRAIEDRHREEIEAYVFSQFVVHEQHRRFRAELHGLGMRVHGDLQIGLSARDAWAMRPRLLRGYLMGAPPSRTNPEGQAWGYPVFDPAQLRDGELPGPVLRLVAERMEKLFDEVDGLRIDHPHGLVCPWVYRADDPDPLHAVRHGARLFAAPDLPDHPELARFAIARREQLASGPGVARWDDGWVRELEPDQVRRYAALFDVVVEVARQHGSGSEDLACEVLSTMPYPLGRVLERHGLGRFRVTQKLDPDDPGDPYRLERARPADWVMIGTHDTPPLWQLLDDWSADRVEARAHYAAALLEPEPARREGFARTLLADRGLLGQAMLAELFASPARHALVFFSDLFGLDESFNLPGTVSAENWSLRLPSSWSDDYRARLGRHRALNVPLALALALRARGARRDLQAGLRGEAASLAALPESWWGALGGTRG